MGVPGGGAWGRGLGTGIKALQAIQVTWVESPGLRGKQRQSLRLGTGPEGAWSVCLGGPCKGTSRESLQVTSLGGKARYINARSSCVYLAFWLEGPGQAEGQHLALGQA